MKNNYETVFVAKVDFMCYNAKENKGGDIYGKNKK